MKKLLLVFLTMICSHIQSIGQSDEKYLNAMRKNVAILDTADKAETFRNLMHNFERIAKVEKTQWLPNYYIAFCASSLAGKEKNNNFAEELTDKAEAYLTIADSLSPDNSEIYVLKAQIAFIQIKVDVMERGIKNTMLASKHLSKALKLDSQNPRVYLLIGMGKFSMPEQVGGNKKAACEHFHQAYSLLEKQPKDDIKPHWGNDDLKYVLTLCDKITPKVANN
jgi:tetratricopeptide (TPR) repeat protein